MIQHRLASSLARLPSAACATMGLPSRSEIRSTQVCGGYLYHSSKGRSSLWLWGRHQNCQTPTNGIKVLLQALNVAARARKKEHLTRQTQIENTGWCLPRQTELQQY